MIGFSAPLRVLVRDVSPAYGDCLREDLTRTIDVALARAQHAAYVAAIRGLGIEVQVVPADPSLPDACFIEDTAVVLGRAALLTRPGAPSRRGEVAPVGEALAPHRSLEAMREPATLDGGDVLRVGARLFVGLSSRTNAEGAAWLGRLAAQEGLTVETLEVRGGLHLKSACSLASPTTLVFDPAAMSEASLRTLEAAGLALVEALEPAGANVLLLGATTLVSAAAPHTTARLVSRGASVRILEMGEIHAGDGALTCLSLRLPAAGAWST